MVKSGGIYGLMALGAGMLVLANYTRIPKNKADDEAHIRQQIENFVKAFRTRDINLMMSLYAPKMVSFDLVPPLEDKGTDVYRKVWEETFKHFSGPIDIQTDDLNIMTGDNTAFSYNLLHLRATTAGGQKVDFWERMTLGFRKIDGLWLIEHEHVSVPVDLENRKAVMDLRPE